MEQRIIGSLTEIYTSGGGNFLTQSYPTNFHTFFTSKVLTAKGDSVDCYTEVTAAERAGIEKRDAEWEEPPQSFIDEWDTLCGEYGRYNPETGFFELNGLIDITYEQSIEIVSYHDPTNRDMVGAAMNNSSLRTLIPRSYRINSDFTRAFQAASAFEVFVASYYTCFPINMSMAFLNCSKLKKISGVIAVNNCISFSSAFTGCTSLEYVQFDGLKSDISFADSPLLTLSSLQYLVDKSANTSPITITVHPDVYAKLTGDTSNAAAAALSPEELERWTALIPLAAEYRLTFTTPT